MNENLNLCEILKDCPKGTKLYCPFLGNVTFLAIKGRIIHVKHGVVTYTFFNDGTYSVCGECMLYPSKEQRDWSKFKVPIKRFNPKEFKPFDKVLVRDGNEFKWHPSFLERIAKQSSDGYSAVELIARCRWKMCIPYNDETKCLSWTKDDCPEYYKWWEE